MPKNKFPGIQPCPHCGKDGQEKNVYKPFPHGWVGCKNCQDIIYWVNGGKLAAIEGWNRKCESIGKQFSMTEARSTGGSQ